MGRSVRVEDLETKAVIIDPEGNETIVRRVHRIDHERVRLTTDAGVAKVAMGTKFTIVN